MGYNPQSLTWWPRLHIECDYNDLIHFSNLYLLINNVVYLLMIWIMRQPPVSSNLAGPKKMTYEIHLSMQDATWTLRWLLETCGGTSLNVQHPSKVQSVQSCFVCFLSKRWMDGSGFSSFFCSRMPNLCDQVQVQKSPPVSPTPKRKAQEAGHLLGTP